MQHSATHLTPVTVGFTETASPGLHAPRIS